MSRCWQYIRQVLVHPVTMFCMTLQIPRSQHHTGGLYSTCPSRLCPVWLCGQYIPISQHHTGGLYSPCPSRLHPVCMLPPCGHLWTVPVRSLSVQPVSCVPPICWSLEDFVVDGWCDVSGWNDDSLVVVVVDRRWDYNMHIITLYLY